MFDLIRMRLATTVTILHWRQSASSAQDPYLPKELQDLRSERFLRHIIAVTREGFGSRVFDAKS